MACSAYVVVEETLGSGEVLHTAQRVPVTGQLTFVPRSFFDQECEALAKTARFFRELAMRYAKALRESHLTESAWLTMLEAACGRRSPEAATPASGEGAPRAAE